MKPILDSLSGGLHIAGGWEDFWMLDEAIVYGYIRDVGGEFDGLSLQARREINLAALSALPSLEEASLVYREMFYLAPQFELAESASSLIHFGASGMGLEYEWSQWMKEFENFLAATYWFSAVVHLETEMSGKHTFCWDADSELHAPNRSQLSVRCEWSRESLLA